MTDWAPWPPEPDAVETGALLDADASGVDSQAVLSEIRALEGTIRARLLYEYRP